MIEEQAGAGPANEMAERQQVLAQINADLSGIKLSSEHVVIARRELVAGANVAEEEVQAVGLATADAQRAFLRRKQF